MGATPWQVVGPYRKNVAHALQAIQAEYFDDNYDLAALLQQRIGETAEAVRLTEEGGDPEFDGLLATYRDSLRRLQRISKRPLPRSVRKQVELLRRIEAHCSSGLDNILDIRGVSKHREAYRVCPLSAAETKAIFGSERPTRDQAEKCIFQVFSLIDRAEAVCFPLYRGRRPRYPIAWYFVGYTVD